MSRNRIILVTAEIMPSLYLISMEMILIVGTLGKAAYKKE